MKASVLSLVFLSGLAAAQSGIPTCATGCVTQFTTGTSIAGCGQLDIACICKNADFLNGIACCLASSCDQAAQTQAVNYAKQICSSAGVSTPDSVVCNEKSSSSSTEASHESTTASESSSSTATTGSSDSSTTDSSESSTTAESSTSGPATTNSASRTTATSAAQQTTSAASTTSSNVAAPLASAGSFVGAAIAVLAAAL
ncbi:CFEM domain-containing protein [Trichoderma breve]|uniref:CFEM domain-containing protein n=1 Tax=Trichoderma breve TaxID=2034170 RepID=A0A9W9B5T5_9HYPO|nr:CFEM domain-containing protein [Trichoderma breve]KAJ4855114.1 CFEM domain-containing protein [Trichoderma breve]